MNEEKSIKHPQAGEILKEAIKNHRETQIILAERLKLSTKQLQNYSKGIFPKFKSDKIKALDKILGTRVYNMVYEGEPKREEKVPNEEQVLQERIADYKKTGEYVPLEVVREFLSQNKTLIDSNSTLADTNKRLVEAHYILVENNRELLQLTKKDSTPYESQQIPSTVQSKLDAVLGYLARIGSGERPWKSLDEAIVVLDKELSGSQSQKSKIGIQQSLSKGNK
jgi:hypothetical protein